MTLYVLRTAFHRLYLVYLVPGAKKPGKRGEHEGGRWPAGGETHHKYKPEE